MIGNPYDIFLPPFFLSTPCLLVMKVGNAIYTDRSVSTSHDPPSSAPSPLPPLTFPFPPPSKSSSESSLPGVNPEGPLQRAPAHRANP